MGVDLSDVLAEVVVRGSWIWDTRKLEGGGQITCFFRRTFNLAELGGATVLHVSGDGRYRAYVNGALRSRGPCRSVPSQYRLRR